MKVSIENLGAVKSAEVEVGDLTIIAGENSTGKSYITYSIWKLFTKIQDYKRIRQYNAEKLKKTFTLIDKVVKNNIYQTRMLLSDFQEIIQEIYLNVMEQELTKSDLSKLFNTSIKRFNNDNLKVAITNTKTPDGFYQLMKKIAKYNIIKNFLLFDFKEKIVEINFQTNLNRSDVFIENNKWVETNSFYMEDEIVEEKERAFLPNEYVERTLQRIFIGFISTLILREEFFTNIEIATTERSGALLFNTQIEDDRDKILSLPESYNNIYYVEPVLKNIQFGRRLSYLTNKNQRIKGDYRDNPIINELELLMGGRVNYNDKDGIHFQPFKKNSCENGQCEIQNENEFFAYHELSSSIRNLTFIYFYLKYQAKKGDLLIIDEPEAYLHPMNQIKMARIVAMMVNSGLKILITTHSDYLIRELNLLVNPRFVLSCNLNLDSLY